MTDGIHKYTFTALTNPEFHDSNVKPSFLFTRQELEGTCELELVAFYIHCRDRYSVTDPNGVEVLVTPDLAQYDSEGFDTTLQEIMKNLVPSRATLDVYDVDCLYHAHGMTSVTITGKEG